MRKISLLAAALILAGVGVWVASSTHARVDAPIDVRVDRIDPSQMMTRARDLPTEHYDDYSFVFN
jgi:hypothetical protein